MKETYARRIFAVSSLHSQSSRNSSSQGILANSSALLLPRLDSSSSQGRLLLDRSHQVSHECKLAAAIASSAMLFFGNKARSRAALRLLPVRVPVHSLNIVKRGDRHRAREPNREWANQTVHCQNIFRYFPILTLISLLHIVFSSSSPLTPTPW